MARINCANCGSTHASVADVRQCHQREAGVPRVVDAVLRGRPGPVELGRSAIVDQGGPTPQGWENARRLHVEATSPSQDLVDELHRAWSSREPLILEVAGDFGPPTRVENVNLWNLDPSIELTSDRLEFLVTANAVDFRGTQPSWRLFDLAVGVGATPSSGAGDVELGDGSVAWLDGGPFGLSEVGGIAVAHNASLESGLPGIATDGSRASTQHVAAIELAPDQQRAVLHPSGPARIIAPAGSGKTRVLTERARHLLGHKRFPTRALTLVAFNKRAQLEMQERTTDLPGLQVRTLNALGLAIVRGTTPFVRSALVDGSVDVITERDVRSILDGLLDLRRKANVDQLAPWLDALTAVRLGLADPSEVEARFGGDVDGLHDLVKKYRSELKRKGVVDFDEQIARAIEVLLADPVARRAAQRSCRAMLVDEFQDLTPAHLLLIRLLAAPGFDVYGVGDDDQTIYGFTGARPDWLIDFANWFPEADHHALEVNYRCPPGVVDGAATLLTHNTRRVKKVIASPENRTRGTDDLGIIGAKDPISATSERVSDLLATGSTPSDIVVLTRVNAALAPVQVALSEGGVAVEQAVGTEFAARSGVRAVLAWLRIASTTRNFDADDIEAAARRPSRGLSPRVVEWMGEQGDINGLRRLAKRLKERDADKIDGFSDDVNTVRRARSDGASTDELIEVIRDEIGLAQSLDALDSSRRTVDRSSHGDDLAALLALGRLHADVVSFESWLMAHLSAGGDPDGVRLSTVHRVKGREWPHVIVVGVDQGRFPHRLSNDLAEERRVFHVGITRSQQSTTVVATASEESRFLAELVEPRDPAAPEEQILDSCQQPIDLVSVPASQADIDLRDRLKEWRLDWSRTEGVPAYVIFNDKTLDDLLLRRPTDLAELGRCHGIGPAKLDKFGDELVGVLSDG